MKKLKVALVCHVSNQEIRSRLFLSSFYWKNHIKRLLGRTEFHYSDYGTWNTLLFNEFKGIDDIELHAIIPHPGMRMKLQQFTIDGIQYHCFNQHKTLFDKSYKSNRRCIKDLIEIINPDIVNVVGLEAPYYSLSALDIDIDEYPLIVSMQTALSDPDFLKNYPVMDKKTFKERKQVEQDILKHVRYIATDASWHRTIASWYNPDAIFLRYHFFANNSVPTSMLKEFDFAYWAADVSKAGDDAILSFIEASKKLKGITLNVIGKCSKEYYNHLQELLAKNGLENQVTFSGYFPTHYEALCQVTKAKCALIPIKVDIVSTTIREAVLMHMPVVTYATKGTPSLNKEVQSILLSEIGDYEEMGNNMVKLLQDDILQSSLSRNAMLFADKYWDNKKAGRMQADMYHAVYEHFHWGKVIAKDLCEAIY